MEVPVSDPMTHAWQEVAESFTSLGRTMRDRYERPATPEEGAAADAGTDTDAPRRGGDPAAALREAFETLLAAGREFGDRTTGLVRDDDVKAELKHVAASLNGALEATVDQIGQEVSGFFKGSREPIEADEHAAPAGDITDAEPPGADTGTRANTAGADDDRA
jgi:hypothetical protein